MDQGNLDTRTAPARPDAGDRLDHRCRIRDAAGGLISPQWCLTHFADTLLSLPQDLTEEQVLRPELRVYADGNGLEVFYTPFELVFSDAQVILVGVTPGRHQLYLAIREAAAALRAGAGATEALERASRVGSFAGPMRTNLTTMLDGVGLHRALGVRTCAVLFDEPLGQVASTSAISHATMVNGQNYTGHTPRIDRPPILRSFITQVLAGQLTAAPQALVVPLGKAASTAVSMCVEAGAVRRDQCLLAFPHPSGQNGTRVQSYHANKEAMAHQIAAWFDMVPDFAPAADDTIPAPLVAVPAQPTRTTPSSSLDRLVDLLRDRATGHDGPLIDVRDDGRIAIRALLKPATKSAEAAFLDAQELRRDVVALGFASVVGDLVGATNGVLRPNTHPMWYSGVLHITLNR